MAILAQEPITVDALSPSGVFGRVLELAREHGLTVYDAYYLELALRERAALATLDDDLRAAARRAGALVVDPT